MKTLPLLLSLLFPLGLLAEEASDSFPTVQDRLTLAKTLGVESEEIQFLERAEFNSVWKRHDRTVKAFRGYVAATDSEIFLILNDRLDARQSDVWSMGIEYLRGVYSTDQQMVVNTHRLQAVVIKFEERDKDLHEGLKHFLIGRGVRSDWEPPNTYTLREFKKPLIGVPYERPSIFASSGLAERSRKVASFQSNWYNHANSWKPEYDHYPSSR